MKHLFMLLLVPAATVLADSWHALRPGRTTPSPASLTVQKSDDSGLTLTASFPGFTLAGRRHPAAGQYLAPEMPGCGVSEPIGSPELPVLRRLIVVPGEADIRVSLSGTPSFFTLASTGVQSFYPRQRPRLKGPRSPKLLPFDFDLGAYGSDGFAPESPCRVVEAGVSAGQRLALVEVFPVAVNPLTQGLRIYPELTITLAFSKKGTKSAAAAAGDGTAPGLAMALNADAIQAPAAKAAPRLLIIAPDAWLDALAPLVNHRQARGWAVDALGTAAAGKTAPTIRASIRNRYDALATRPDALLLVGDVAQIPCFTGTQVDSPDTDLYFACMDGTDDWQPEFPVGRISVQSLESLDNVLSKILACETAPSALWMSQAAFMAGEDNYSITEGTHNAVIHGWLDARGYQADTLYAISHDATPAQVKAAFNAGRVMGVYSGHGDTTYWADGPVFYKADVQGLSNRGRYPMIFSFACLTGQYSLNECFAETWLRVPEKGAACVLASSVTSYWDEDDILERHIFAALFDDHVTRFGETVMRAKYKLIETYGLTATVRRYFEQYNFLGDPVTPLRQPALSIITSSPLPTGMTGEGYSEPLRATGGSEPYTWSLLSNPPEGLGLDPNTGILSGIPSVAAEEALFTVRLADAASAVTTRQFRISVASEPLHITGGTNAGPFQAGAPFSTSLTASGGIGPYAWAYARGGFYESATTVKAPVAPPNAKAWSGDERSWKLRLPWAFRFFETSYTSLWVNSNGYLDFKSKASQYDNTTSELLKHPRIAPLWDDLHTTNVFLNFTSTRVVIRWTGYTYNSKNPVDFQVVLKKNGKILFIYSRMPGKLSPTIGVSSGDGSSMTLSDFDGRQSFQKGDCTRLDWRPPLPPGTTLGTNGVLSGTVESPVTRTIPITVQDRSVPVQTASAVLTLRVD
jgi:hypothetical protein